MDLDVVPPSTEEPVAVPAEGELAVSSPLLPLLPPLPPLPLLPPPALQGVEAGGQDEEDQPALPGGGSGRHLSTDRCLLRPSEPAVITT